MKVKDFKDIIAELPDEDEVFIKEFRWCPTEK